jgi:hypothetical protein
MQVVVDIPDRLAGQLLPEGEDPARTMLEDRIAQAYREGRLTTEEVRQALGLGTRFEVEPFLLKYGIFDYTSDMLTQDLARLERLRV